MELEAEISEITLRRLVWRCLVCTDIVFFPFSSSVRLVAVFAVPEKKCFFFFYQILKMLSRRRVELGTSRLHSELRLLLPPLTFIASEIIFPKTCHRSCLSGILPRPHLRKMFFSPSLFPSLTKRVCFLGQIILFISSKSAAFRRGFFFFHSICQMQLRLL